MTIEMIKKSLKKGVFGFLKNNLLVVAISASLLIVSSSLGYYYVFYIPKKDAQKIEQQNLENQQQKEEGDSRQRSLSLCLSQADQNYHDNWNSECKSQGKLSDSCIKLLDMTFDEYADKNDIPSDKRLDAIDEFYNKRDECSCRLSFTHSDRIDGWKEKEKDECYKKFGSY